jgi:hypothetical protein
MPTNALKLEIDAYASRLMRAGRLFKLAEQGAVTPRAAASYLYNLYYVIQYTEPHLALAAAAALARGDRALAAFFEHKAGEERGHEAWAASDLARLVTSFGLTPPAVPKRSMEGLVRTLERAIHREPSSYVVYVIFVEYFTVIAGPAWLRLLTERCRLPLSVLSVVDHHVELDREHAAHAFAELERVVPAEAMPSVLEMARTAMSAVEAFYEELADEITGASPGEDRANHAA